MKKIVAIVTLSLIMIQCTTQKRNCGSNRQHRQRSKSVKKFAPGWSSIHNVNTKTSTY